VLTQFTTGFIKAVKVAVLILSLCDVVGNPVFETVKMDEFDGP
jgi:hypothetical protein